MIDETNSYRLHLASSNDLVTTPARFSGWSASLRFERKRRAAHIAEQGRALRVAISGATTPKNLARVKGIESALLTASGVPERNRLHWRQSERAAAIKVFIDKALSLAGPDFVEELIHRFLSTQEGVLDASMSNAGDVLAQRKIARALIAAITLRGLSYLWEHPTRGVWSPQPKEDSDIELNLRGLSWEGGRKRRTVVFNLYVPFLRNSVAVCMLDCEPDNLQAAVRSPSAYVALGELKGGGDSGWEGDNGGKTAKAALDKIRKGFAASGNQPHIFFIGAAIAKKMAQEIWAGLEAGTLSNAANLTNDDQVASLSRWLCSL